MLKDIWKILVKRELKEKLKNIVIMVDPEIHIESCIPEITVSS